MPEHETRGCGRVKRQTRCESEETPSSRALTAACPLPAPTVAPGASILRYQYLLSWPRTSCFVLASIAPCPHIRTQIRVAPSAARARAQRFNKSVVQVLRDQMRYPTIYYQTVPGVESIAFNLAPGLRGPGGLRASENAPS
eukprot:1997577-Rhodomonas_salina.1